jgi:hypothetical protein
MLYKARGHAQRAAEAAALAGASAFVDFAAVDPEALDSAPVRARRFAESNAILNRPVTPAEVTTVDVVPDSSLVRVVVGRQQVGTWFARLLGVASVPINASAAARAESAGGGKCIKPFAVPDTWNERGQDGNNDDLEDNGESWSYDPGQDTYNPGNPDNPGSGTGYGSGLRDGAGPYISDYGRPISLRLPDPTSPTPYNGPQQFRPFSSTGNTNDVGEYRDHVEGCDPSGIRLGQNYRLMSPNPEIPVATQQGVDSLIQTDPDAHWDDNTQTVRDSRYTNWRDSPRIIRMGFFDPGQLGPGQTTVRLNNLGLMFVEGWDGSTNSLNGRFFFFATGIGDLNNPNFGTLTKRLRLVE